MNRGALLRSAALATLVLVLTPATTPGQAQEPVVFGVVGDSGEVTPGLRGVVREMLAYRRDRARFDFVLLLGDNIYRDGVGRGIQKVFEAPFADLLAADVQFYAVLGNHDIRRGTELQINYAAWNMSGRRFYSFSKGEGLVEFFALDSTALSDEARALVLVEKARLDNERAALQARRRRSRHRNCDGSRGSTRSLARMSCSSMNKQPSRMLSWCGSGMPWRIPGRDGRLSSYITRFIPPQHDRGPRRRTVGVETAASLEPIFVQGGVDLVLAGHDHHYDRSTLQPASAPASHQVQYVTEGASARLRASVVDHTNTFLAKADATTHSFLIVEVAHDAIAH